MRRYRPVRTGRQIPLPVGLAAIGVCLILGLLTITIGTGLLGTVAGQVGSAFGNAMVLLSSQAPATAPPSGLAMNTPVLDPAANGGYTQLDKLNLTGSVPGGTIGKAGYFVRIYSIDQNNNRRQLFDVAVGGTTQFVSPEITLVEGQNVFAVALVTPTGEGQPSPKVTYTLDTKPPKITVSSPAQGGLQRSATVEVSGQTDPGATVSIHNEMVTGGGPANKTVGTDGKFKIPVTLVAGPNTIDITSTDQAGNSSTYTLNVKRDPGQLAPHLVVSQTKFSAAKPTTLTLTIHATTANGSPLANASAVFTVAIYGLPAIVSDPRTTDSKGMATWQIAISGASAGPGQASVLVTAPSGDQTTGSVRITTT